MAPELLERSCLPRCIFLVVSDAECKILPSTITITGYIPCWDTARIKFHLFVLCCCPWTLNWNRESLIFFLKLELKVRTRQWWTNYRSGGWWGERKKNRILTKVPALSTVCQPPPPVPSEWGGLEGPGLVLSYIPTETQYRNRERQDFSPVALGSLNFYLYSSLLCVCVCVWRV